MEKSNQKVRQNESRALWSCSASNQQAVDVSRCPRVSQVYADVESSPVNIIVVGRRKIAIDKPQQNVQRVSEPCVRGRDGKQSKIRVGMYTTKSKKEGDGAGGPHVGRPQGTLHGRARRQTREPGVRGQHLGRYFLGAD